MSLNSMLFIWLFLPVSLVLGRAFKPKYQNLILMMLSLLFWFWNDPNGKPYLLGTVLLTYGIGFLLDRVKNISFRRGLLAIGLIADLGLLAVYKAFHSKVVAPVAISFISFSLVSYLVDVYKGDARPRKNLVDYLLYVTFFPKLLMGPIERYRDFDRQLTPEGRDYSLEHFTAGVRLFIIGLAKKVLIADVLATAADRAFSDTGALTASGAWVGALCFTLQLYYDFSGYSEMAQGIGNMFGFSLTRNFDYPYLSQSVTEFWRRWHITLGSWFRNYLYIPLGGNRKGRIRTYVNLFIVFLATGIWHGNGLTFLLWGVYHGVWIVVERMGLKKLGEKNKLKWVNILICDLVVLIGWVLFRADSFAAAWEFLKTMFGGRAGAVGAAGAGTAGGILTAGELLSKKLLFTLIIGFIGVGIIQQLVLKVKILGTVCQSKAWYVLETIALFIFLVLSVMSVSSGTYSAFLYAKF